MTLTRLLKALGEIKTRVRTKPCNKPISFGWNEWKKKIFFFLGAFCLWKSWRSSSNEEREVFFFFSLLKWNRCSLGKNRAMCHVRHENDIKKNRGGWNTRMQRSNTCWRRGVYYTFERERYSFSLEFSFDCYEFRAGFEKKTKIWIDFFCYVWKY